MFLTNTTNVSAPINLEKWLYFWIIKLVLHQVSDTRHLANNHLYICIQNLWEINNNQDIYFVTKQFWRAEIATVLWNQIRWVFLFWFTYLHWFTMNVVVRVKPVAGNTTEHLVLSLNKQALESHSTENISANVKQKS